MAIRRERGTTKKNGKSLLKESHLTRFLSAGIYLLSPFPGELPFPFSGVSHRFKLNFYFGNVLSLSAAKQTFALLKRPATRLLLLIFDFVLSPLTKKIETRQKPETISN